MKFRLCSIILNAEKYRKLVRYPAPFGKDIQPICNQRELEIKYEVVHYEGYKVERTGSSSKWVVECEARINRIGMTTHFFIFRGLKPHMFFISWSGHDEGLLDYCYL
jgi:hypothetical protein